MEKKIREVKDEANSTSPPLFRRVHLNDIEKGGRSRAPSHVPDSSSTMSIAPAAATRFSHGACLAGKREKNPLVPFRESASPSKLADKQNSSSQSVGKSSVTVDTLDGKKAQISNSPAPRESFSSVTKPNLFGKTEYHFKNFSFKALTSLDYLRVPELGCSKTELHSRKDLKESIDLSLQLQKPETVLRVEQVSNHNYDDVSDSSGMESASGLSASPNHLVKVIRDKQYSRMRTTMIEQQRIFAAQVFELHRLITVQKRLARSPSTILERKGITGKLGTMKKLSNVLKMAPGVKPELKPTTEYLEKSVIPKLPLPSLSKDLITHKTHPAVTNENPSNPWWFSSSGNHWLVPVMSPSEGLVYKPYSGLCPPPASGFVVSVFGDDSFETALGFPVSHQTNPFGHIGQGMSFCVRKPETSKDSEVQALSCPMNTISLYL
ncbi:PREDICTED: protein HEADING DATE 3B [Tarenaya hassleriana]|uniref:protein HEADING DATE 3B n=1 Tax=Tarenaya hassleriana TaxID=28532 RepID=UPI00053C09CB|nr:PREDICTED: protein HEADING DATE 3B [Tarenaya hassleriana]